MRRFLQSVLVAVVLGTGACAGKVPPTITTPQGKAALTADEIAVRVNELGKAVIDAQAQNQIPLATARDLIQFCSSADKTLAAAPAGWQAVVGKAWAEVKAKLPPTLAPLVQSAINLVDIALAAYGGNE
jgi:hypothetical protein